MSKRLSVSVLVITWNEKQLLSRCLENLCANFDFDEDEIVVIDNGSIDDTSEMVSERFPSVRYYCLLYTSPSPRDATLSRMPSSA